MLRNVESFVTFSQFFTFTFLPEENFLWSPWKVFLQTAELFGDRINLKGLVFLVSDLCWMEASHGVVIPIYLFLLWNKTFFDYLLSHTLDFGRIDAPVSELGWEPCWKDGWGDRSCYGRLAGVDLVYSFKSTVVLVFDFVVTLTLFWNLFPKKSSAPCQSNELH